MKIYKCLVSGDELFTDAKPKNVQKLDDVGFFKVKGEHIKRTEGDYQLAGANPSQEEGGDDEGTEATTVTGIDIEVDGHYTATQTTYESVKKFAKVLFGDYIKLLKETVADKYPEQKEALSANLKKFQAWLSDPPVPLGEVETFYTKSYSPDGMLAMKTWITEDGNDVPYYWYMIAGVEEEKV